MLVNTGTLTGEQNDIGAGASHISWITAIVTIPWRRVFDFMAISHIWLGNWSFLVVRAWMYRVIELAFVLAGVGIVVQLRSGRNSLPTPKPIYLIAMPYTLLLIGLCFDAVQAFRSAGTVGTMGYYLLCLVVPETILLLVGWFRLWPDRLRLWSIPILALLFNALDHFGTIFLLLPYYGGRIEHDSHGNLPALRISQLTNGGLRNLIDNLLANKPRFLTSSQLMMLLVLSFTATLALLTVACAIALRPNGSVRKTEDLANNSL